MAGAGGGDAARALRLGGDARGAAAVALAGAPSSSARRTCSAGAGVSVRRMGATSCVGCAAAAGRGALRVTAATTAKPTHKLTVAAKTAPSATGVGRSELTAPGTPSAARDRASSRGPCAGVRSARG
jgi:hypothetical protein